MNCGRSETFVSHYLFDNGKPCDPEKIRVRQTEAGKFFKKTSKGFFYQSKELRSLNGAAVTNFSNIEPFNAFVLVSPHENFINCPYQEAFKEIVSKQQEYKKKLSENDHKQRTKSAPAVPSFCGEPEVVREKSCGQSKAGPRSSACANKSKVTLKMKSSNRVEDCNFRGNTATELANEKKSSTSCESKAKTHRHCVSSDKYACCDEDSDDDIEIDEVEDVKVKADDKKQKQSRTSRNDAKAVKPAKKGFFATCCATKPKAVPCSDKISRPSTSSNQCDNGKATQTSLEDFKRAQKCLKMSIQQEKRRLKMYGRNTKKNKDKFECTREEPKMCIDGVEVKISQHELEKKEADYKKARAKYLAKRKRMERKINKALAKEAKMKPKC